MNSDGMNNETMESNAFMLKPFTVSAIYDDGLEAVIVHCVAADAQAARDQVIMEKNGRIVIASVFAGHLIEPDAVVFRAGVESGEEEADGNRCM